MINHDISTVEGRDPVCGCEAENHVDYDRRKSTLTFRDEKCRYPAAIARVGYLSAVIERIAGRKDAAEFIEGLEKQIDALEKQLKPNGIPEVNVLYAKACQQIETLQWQLSNKDARIEAEYANNVAAQERIAALERELDEAEAASEELGAQLDSLYAAQDSSPDEPDLVTCKFALDGACDPDIPVLTNTGMEEVVNYALAAQSKLARLEKELEEARKVTGETSDGYHTFNELYDHRIALFIALAQRVGFSWRSKLHSDGTMFDGWFILGMFTSPGMQITYHLPLAQWVDTEFAPTLDRAPAWDGHTPADVLKRIAALNEPAPPAQQPAERTKVSHFIDLLTCIVCLAGHEGIPCNYHRGLKPPEEEEGEPAPKGEQG